MLSRTIGAFALSALLSTSCMSSRRVDEAVLPVLTPMEAAELMFAEAEVRPVAAAAGTFDVETLNTLLGGIVHIAYDSAGTDPETGAYQLTGMRAEILGDEPMTLFTAESALFWNADLEGLTARINGEGLDQTLHLFDRIELNGVSMDLTDYSNAIDDAVSSAMLEELQSLDGSVEISPTVYDEASMTVGQIVLGGMTLHPWTFEEIEGQDEGLSAIRLISAAVRNFSLDTSYFSDARMTQHLRQDDVETSLVSVYDRQIIQGYDRGNIASIAQTGVSFSADIPIPVHSPEAAADGEDSLPEATTVFQMAGKTDFSAWNGLQFATLLEWGERGELPPVTEKDLWSFGNYIVSGSSMDLGGKPLLRIGHLEASADKFSWFFPERITFRNEDTSFHLADMLMAFSAFEPEMDLKPGDPTMSDIAGMLERAGFGTISGDGDFAFTWDSETGATLLESDNTADGLYADSTRMALTLPSYTALVPGFGIDGRTPDTDMLTEILSSSLVFSGGHYSLTDGGLLDAVASIVIEFSKYSAPAEGEEAGDANMLGGFADSTPDAVRSMASMMLLFAGGAVTQEIPGAEGWIPALSGFISSGGTLRIGFDPETPVTAASFAPPDGGMAETAIDFVNIFGVTVTHTPPPETETAETP